MLSQVTLSSPPYGGGVWMQEGRIKFSSADLDKTVELLFDCILRLLTNMRSEELYSHVNLFD